jgi:hypothetical protein
MESATDQWVGLVTALLLASMVLSPFIFTWKYCDRPEIFLRRCLRATVSSLIVLAVSGAALLLFFQSHFPAGELLAKVKETAGQGLMAAAFAPLLGTDFLMRMKLKYRWHKARGQHEL